MKPTSLRGIANRAASDKAHRLRNLFGMLTVGYLLWCWWFVNKHAASGVDRQDARSYQEDLRENIEALVAAVKEGRYRAKSVLRRYIPKLSGKLRPLGIPAIADKLLQVGVSKLLEAIYEQDFLGCGYGYRPGVGALDAVRVLSAVLKSGRYHYLVEADIRGFFDDIDHEKLMNLSELRYVVALARARHFGRAAEACFVSQPTLSIAVKKLENELGVRIFERGAQNVQVTPVGERIVERAQRALEAVEAVKHAADEGRNQLVGPLRLGAIYTVGPYLFPDLITHLQELAPEMPLLVEENYTAVLAERLKRGELDVIIISLPFTETNVLTLPLYEEPFVILLPSAHPLTARKTLDGTDLEGETILLLGSGHCFRDQVIDACPSCAPRPPGQGNLGDLIEGGSLETIRHMVASGMGLTVLPCTAAGVDRYAQRLVRIRRFSGPVPSRRVALAWRATFPRPKVIDALRAAVSVSGLSCVDLFSDDHSSPS